MNDALFQIANIFKTFRPLHYEQNWFNQWPFSETHPNSTFPVGQNNKKAARPDKPWGFWAPCHLFCVFGLILPFYQYISAKLILPSISQNGHCLNQFCSQCNALKTKVPGIKDDSYVKENIAILHIYHEELHFLKHERGQVCLHVTVTQIVKEMCISQL